LVQEAAARAIHDGVTQYTPALGIPELRERISDWYSTRFGVNVPARRIVITAGASAALQLACLALIEAGDEVLMPDPSYPCNRHFVSAAEAPAVMTIRRAGTFTPKRELYQALMRSRNSGMPRAGVYCVTPSCTARAAASCTKGGAVKSGSPMLRKIMGASVCATKAARSAAAFATSIT